jgi:hypothetical protein
MRWISKLSFQRQSVASAGALPLHPIEEQSRFKSEMSQMTEVTLDEPKFRMASD